MCLVRLILLRNPPLSFLPNVLDHVQYDSRLDAFLISRDVHYVIVPPLLEHLASILRNLHFIVSSLSRVPTPLLYNTQFSMSKYFWKWKFFDSLAKRRECFFYFFSRSLFVWTFFLLGFFFLGLLLHTRHLKSHLKNYMVYYVVKKNLVP